MTRLQIRHTDGNPRNNELSNLKVEVVTEKPVLHLHPGFRDGWVARLDGAARAIRWFSTKLEARPWAISEARRRGMSLYIHYRDGTIERVVFA